MRSEHFELFRRLMRERAGHAVGPDRAFILEQRLMPVARRWNARGVDDLAVRLSLDGEERMQREAVEAMLTTESAFFRDVRPFRALREEVLPRLAAARGEPRRLRIWSAGCAWGQEPYSIAMLVREAGAAFGGAEIEIVASDLSNDALERAARAAYGAFDVQRGMPIRALLDNFDQEDAEWRVKRPVREMVSFRPFNLVDDPAPLGRFDVILCRYVLGYFEEKARARLLGCLIGALADDGVLVLGEGELADGTDDRLRASARGGGSMFVKTGFVKTGFVKTEFVKTGFVKAGEAANGAAAAVSRSQPAS